MRVLINGFMCTYVIWVCSKVTGCTYLVAGSCEFTCLKFRVPTLSGGMLGLNSERFCVSTLYSGRLGVFLCLNISELYVYAKVS